MTRHSLMLTAVATVTVPGLLAVMAVVGHGHAAAEAGGMSAALDGPPLPGSATAAVTPGAPMHDVTAQRVSSAPATVLSSMMNGQRALGMRMLVRAASASLATSYQGTELVWQSGVDGSVTTVSQVWHQGGGRALVEMPAGAGAGATEVTVDSSDPASGSPVGLFGATQNLLAVLEEHYVALYWGSGSVAGRPASVVGLYRPNGSLAAQYWLDDQTMMPLRRELYDTSGQNVISEDSFVRIRFGAFTLPQAATAGAVAAQQAQPSQPAWTPAASPATFLRSLIAAGWRAPAASPGGLPLYAASSATTSSGEVVDLEYSDGLYDISLFLQRGTLAPNNPGWRPVSVAGQRAFVSGRSVTWAGPGFVYTMVADVPPQTVAQVVKGLSGGGQPGILARFARGFNRLARVINPFG